ncbi:MAG: hypothetical protein M3294_02680 [Pseudomonadota bacterium]|nr:hypothetical protein [Pseudomonadota bacterium]
MRDPERSGTLLGNQLALGHYRPGRAADGRTAFRLTADRQRCGHGITRISRALNSISVS